MHQIRLCIAVVGFVASASSAVYGQSRPAGDRIGQQSRMASRSDNDRVVGVISGGTEGTYIRIAADLANVLDSPDLRILRGLAQRVASAANSQTGQLQPLAASFNHLVRKREQCWRDDEAHSLRGFQVEREDELARALDRQIGGLGSAQNAVREDGGAAVNGAEDRGVSEQKPRIGIEEDLAGSRQTARDRRFGNALSEVVDDRIGDD